MVSSHLVYPERNRRVRTIYIAIALILATCLVLLALISRSKQEGWKQYESQSLGFAVSYLGTWRPSEDQNMFTLVDTKSRADDFQSYVRISVVSPFADGQSFDKIHDLEGGSDISSLFLSREFTSRSIKKVSNLTVDSKSAFETSEEVRMPGPYYSNSIYILNGEKTYVIHLTAASSEELAREQETFRKIVSTLKFKKVISL